MNISKYFAAKKDLYTQNIKGRFRNLKNILNIIFLTIYILTPLIRFKRDALDVSVANQAVLFDFKESKIYFFIFEIWPNETYYLASILILAAVGLFFITSLFGRIWCGYSCFQTVWSDIFLMVERFFQGDRNQRIINNRKSTIKNFIKKLLTHCSWLLISLLTGLVFICYFDDAILIYQNLFRGNFTFLTFNQWGWCFGIAFMTYIMAGFAREHVCIYMCPYAKFQSVMFDDDSLIISYDQKRGEPRGKISNKTTQNQSSINQFDNSEIFKDRGHCIDCKQCVVVCPQGIDIRDGLQMECIACGLCIDACDDIMKKIGLPTGLIRYDTKRNLDNPNIKNRFKIFRPRTFYYLAIITIISSITIFNLANKKIFDFAVSQNRNPLFIRLSDGSIRNKYHLDITNKSHQDEILNIKIIGNSSAIIKINNQQYHNINVDKNSNMIIAKKNDRTKIDFFITIDEKYLQNFNYEKEGMIDLMLEIENQDKNIKQNIAINFIAE
jgi:cytochrome c oxidase accessory protein FixG